MRSERLFTGKGEKEMEAMEIETKKTWRDVIEIHPAANVFALLPQEGLKGA